jgi:carbonic anhydrase
MILIPRPSRHCNEKWNYQKLGNDWECECAEGKEQSPIDLPLPKDAIDTSVKPIFQYDRVDPTNNNINTIDQQLSHNKNIQLKIEDHALKIKHMRFGKAVTLDGAVYYAEEIVFHTPSEHKLNGKQYDLEVQIIHYGQSKGDIAKQLTLSFLFEAKAGIYNKFIDDIDFFNLPDIMNPQVDLIKEIYIPKILYEATSTDEVIMKPFSFFTYQGSLTFPPCVEDTIVYVASQPLYIGTTALQLFTEALRVPDLMGANGNVIVSDWIPNSRREIQEINGRPIFHYDHEKQCGKDPKPIIIDKGHYEKIQKVATKYFFINNSVPSGVPNAFVVSKDEALGIKPTREVIR